MPSQRRAKRPKRPNRPERPKRANRPKRAKLGRHLYWRGSTIYGWYFDTDRTPIKRSTETNDPAIAAERLASWERDASDPATALRRGATLGDAFDLLVADRKALVAVGKRSADSLPFFDFHARAWLLFAGRLIAGRLASEVKKAERVELIAIGRRAALETVDRHFADGFVEYRRTSGTSENTLAKERGILRGALYLAQRRGLWEGSLDDLFPPGFRTNYEPKRVFWTHGQAQAVLAALATPHRRAQAAYVLATGAEKRAVMRALRTDPDARPIPLRGTKTKDRARSCPVLFAWQVELLDYAKAHADGAGGLLFTDWANAARDLAIACTKAGVPVVSLHGLRHVFGAWCLDEGLSEGIVAKFLGHRDLRQIAMTYDTRDPNALQRRAEAQLARRAGHAE